MAWNEPGNNNRDPWSQGPGGKRRDAQPDLDQLIKRLKSRLGGRDGKGVGGGALALVALLLVLLWLLSGFYTVDEQDRAVVVRLGAYARTAGPGPHWHLPPLEHVKRITVTTPRQASVQSELLTKDQNLVEVGLSVQFRVSSPEDYYFNVDRPDDTLRQAARSALQQAVAGYTIDQVVLGEQQSAIANQVRQLLQRMLDTYQCGLQVTDVSLVKPEPPEEVQAAFYDTIKAVEDQKRTRNEAQAYAAGVLPKAHGDAGRDVTQAQAYRDQAIARAEGDAARFTELLEEYRKAPQVTRKRLYLETMSEIYGGAGKVLIDVDKSSPSFGVPLQQLLAPPPAAAAETPAAAAEPPATVTVPAPPAVAPGGDDSGGSRSRSREDR